jgi:hypothetical protein
MALLSYIFSALISAFALNEQGWDYGDSALNSGITAPLHPNSKIPVLFGFRLTDGMKRESGPSARRARRLFGTSAPSPLDPARNASGKQKFAGT